MPNTEKSPHNSTSIVHTIQLVSVNKKKIKKRSPLVGFYFFKAKSSTTLCGLCVRVCVWFVLGGGIFKRVNFISTQLLRLPPFEWVWRLDPMKKKDAIKFCERIFESRREFRGFNFYWVCNWKTEIEPQQDDGPEQFHSNGWLSHS